MVQIDQEKLAKMQKAVQIGGKGTARRKKKILHKSGKDDDKKLQTVLKKLSCNNIPGIEEVNIIKDDSSVIHFTNPKVQATVQANTFAISGTAEQKSITDLFPGILNQLVGMSSSLPNKSKAAAPIAEDDDDVPDLVENFDNPSKTEAV